MILNPLKDRILKKALLKKSKIILPEESDKRIIKSKNLLSSYGFNIISNIELEDNKSLYIDIISSKRFANNWTKKMLISFLNNPVNCSLVALENNDVDCLVAGAITPTADIIRSAIRIVGLKETARWISSIFFMVSPDYKTTFTFADCAVIPDPNSEQLCMIAYEAAKLHKLLSGDKPNVAFLSFSTNNSAEHYKVKKVQDAVIKFNKKYPNINHEGEMQFDAAINEEIAIRKNYKSKLRGKANVFVFPDLDSGNISYKITQYLANYRAWGPLLLGFKKPILDLSRGCSVDDIVTISMISALQK